MVNAKIVLQPGASRSIGARLAASWFTIFVLFYGLWVGLPFLAPVFMHLNWSGAGKAIYFIYSVFCHQLPERSFFLFGQKSMYSIKEINSVWKNTLNPMILRQFIGDESMGWKVAWSDRMVSLYTSIWSFALVWRLIRRKVRPLPWWGLVLLLLPIVLDGGAHLFSDLSGFGNGFRDTNQWLSVLTSASFPSSFYLGDALGSFNSWMRILTGLLAGLGIVWFAFPYLEESFAQG